MKAFLVRPLVEHLGAHLREEEHFLDGRLVGQHHDQSVDADADAAGGRHAVFQGTQKVLVNEHGFIVAAFAELQLVFEPLALVVGIVELAVRIRHFGAVDHQLEPLRVSGVVAVDLGQRRHFHRVVHDEGGLHVMVFTLLAEQFIDELALAHAVIGFDAHLFTRGAQLSFGLAVDVDTGVFEDGIAHGDPAVGRSKVDFRAVEVGLGSAVHRLANVGEQVFRGLHHPMVILVRDVQFQHGEFRVVRAVHALVPEVAGELIHAFKAAHDEPLEVQFVGNA